MSDRSDVTTGTSVPPAPREVDADAGMAPEVASADASRPRTSVGEPKATVAEKMVEPMVVQEKIAEKRAWGISDEELSSLKEELELLREQVRSKGESLRSKDERLSELEEENTRLRAEYNLQNLKRDMLVHMWSMHMLDADAEDDASE